MVKGDLPKKWVGAQSYWAVLAQSRLVAKRFSRSTRPREELVPVRALRQGSGQALTGNAHAPVLSVSRQSGAVGEGLLLVVEAGEQGIALAVDELIGQQQVLIQPLQGHLADVQGISGCALLGEGDVGVIPDLNRMNV
jgi:two-component system chemotaxis sensor kinase CheA